MVQKYSNTLNNIVKYMENVDVDSFLEVENMHGMSAEAYGTLEMREMHKSLIEGFSFKHSPILDDLKTLNEIPENKILSPSELSQHRQDVTVLLEKAMTGWGAAKSLFKGASKVGGKAKDKVGNAAGAVKDKVGDAAGAVKDKLGDKEGVDNIASGAVEKIKNEPDTFVAIGDKCNGGQQGVCINTKENQCTVGTLSRKCKGAAHIRCCPSSLVKKQKVVVNVHQHFPRVVKILLANPIVKIHAMVIVFVIQTESMNVCVFQKVIKNFIILILVKLLKGLRKWKNHLV